MSSTSASPPANTNSIRRLNPEAVRYNARVINIARALLAALAGIAAGILGLTGLFGFAFYIIASTLMSIIIFLSLILASDRDGPTSHSENTLNALLLKYWGNPYGLWIDEVGGNLVSYVLFLTFAYGIVHVYD